MQKSNHPFYLDTFSLRNDRLSKQRYQAIANYFWEHYCYFAQKRSEIIEELKQALAVNCNTYAFSHWQRIVGYKFSLDPLSAKGSILNDPGGRFNIGDIDQIKFSQFGALYIAEDRETAYREKFGLYPDEKNLGLSADELSLTSSDSVSIVTLKGDINQVLDITKTASLKDFFNLLKNIKLPKSLLNKAKKLNLNPIPHQIKTPNELKSSLLLHDWRQYPMFIDIPANSQIFGQIAYLAGIEAILYPSKMSEKKCLAVFPKNFAQSPSYIEIDNEVPDEIKCRRLDAHTYLNLI